MKENEDKNLGTFVDKVMNEVSLESPSFDFTANVMMQVEKAKQNAVTTYHPLISKRFWALILVGFIAFMIYIFIVIKPESLGWFNNIDLNTDRISKLFSGMKTTRIAAYGVGLLALMLLVQIPVLKNYFDKRLAI